MFSWFKNFYIICLLIVVIGCDNHSNKQFNKDLQKKTIVGFSLHTKKGKVYLLNATKEILEITNIRNHKFHLQLPEYSKPFLYYLKFDDSSIIHPFVFENKPVKVFEQDNAVLFQGGNLQRAFSKFQNEKKINDTKKSVLLEDFSILNIGLKEYLHQVDSIRSIEKKQFTNFIIENKDNLLSKYVLNTSKVSSKGLKTLKQSIKKSVSTQSLLKDIDLLIENIALQEVDKRIKNRPLVPIFSGINLNGRQTHLEKIIKNKKLFLIDFWASWCPPCRASSPIIKEFYRKYHKKGFDILTVSEDRSVEDWKNGVYNDGIDKWHHIYDDFNRISSLFDVGPLPHMVLIDENGKIIKNKISISRLEAYLKETFEDETTDN